MKNDEGLAKMMEDLDIDIPKRVDRSPAGWTWHHVSDRPGVMQLVPRGQHQGSAWQSLLHEGQEGGFNKWGSDY
jgi:hypothetical protein